jgi:hypothetical protein
LEASEFARKSQYYQDFYFHTLSEGEAVRRLLAVKGENEQVDILLATA